MAWAVALLFLLLCMFPLCLQQQITVRRSNPMDPGNRQLQVDGDDLGAQYYQQAMVLLNSGDFANGELLLAKALESSSNPLVSQVAQLNLAVLMEKQNRFDVAIEGYKKVLEANPSYHIAQEALANAYLLKAEAIATGQLHGSDQTLAQSYKASQAAYVKAYIQSPDVSKFPMSNFLLSFASVGDKGHEAVEVMSHAISTRSDFVEVFVNSIKLVGSIDPYRFIDYLRFAIVIEPESSSLHNNIGIVYRNLGHVDAALNYFRQAVKLPHQGKEARNNYAKTLEMKKQYHESLQFYHDVLREFPGDKKTLYDIASLNRILCSWGNFEREELNALAAIRNVRVQSSDQLPNAFDAQIFPCGPRDLQLLSRRETDLLTHTPPPTIQRSRVDPSRISGGAKLRVGYVSSDFRSHVVCHLILGLLRAHDRSKFTVVAFSLNTETDHYTQMTQGYVDEFYNIASFADRVYRWSPSPSNSPLSSLSPQDAAKFIESKTIDFLVDLNGHTQMARPEIFNQRPSPVQIVFLGFTGTMGHPNAFDFIVCDERVIPDGDAKYFDEKRLIMPHSYMVNNHLHSPLGQLPPLHRRSSQWFQERKKHNLPSDAVVFGNFNRLHKIHPRIFAVWMNVLRRVPESVLWLRSSPIDAQANLEKEAMSHGIGVDRVIFAPFIASNEESTQRTRLMDVYVDTTNFNAHSTAADALYMGVPIVTVEGNTMGSRVTASLLSAVGMDVNVRGSLKAYEDYLVDLSSNRTKLEAMQQNLDKSKVDSHLFNTSEWTKDFERALVMAAKQTVTGDGAFNDINVR